MSYPTKRRCRFGRQTYWGTNILDKLLVRSNNVLDWTVPYYTGIWVKYNGVFRFVSQKDERSTQILQIDLGPRFRSTIFLNRERRNLSTRPICHTVCYILFIKSTIPFVLFLLQYNFLYSEKENEYSYWTESIHKNVVVRLNRE